MGDGVEVVAAGQDLGLAVGEDVGQGLDIAGQFVALASDHQDRHLKGAELRHVPGWVLDAGGGGECGAIFALFVGELAEAFQHRLGDSFEVIGQHGVGHGVAGRCGALLDHGLADAAEDQVIDSSWIGQGSRQHCARSHGVAEQVHLAQAQMIE